MRNVFYFSKKVRLFSQSDVLFLFYFLINPAGTTVNGFSICKKFWKAETQGFSTIPSILDMSILSIQDKDL